MQVLDHGYISIVESWGSDERIIEAARMSTSKGFHGWGVEETCDRCRGRGTNEPENGPGSLCKQCGGRKVWINKPGDEKLLRFLYENRHMTPFEMAGLTIEVQAPIFVFREWHRHRTQCLGPDTLVHFEAPKGDRNGRRFVYKMRIEDVWKKWQPTVRASRPERQTNALFPRERIMAMRLRCLDEERKEYVQTRVVDVIRGEPKRMVRVTTQSGRSLVATRAHRVLTMNVGWVTLGEAIDERMLLTLEGTTRGKSMRWEVPPVDETAEEWREVVGWRNYQVSSEGRVRRKGCAPKQATPGADGYNVVSLSSEGTTALFTVHSLVLTAFRGAHPDGTESRHLNNNRADARLSNLAWGTPEENARDRVEADRQQRLVPVFEEIANVEEMGELPTFDLAVEGPWHNFVADGFVVHNSYNEMSARYTPLPDVNYVPSVERLLINSKTNKQAGVVKGAEELTAEVAETYRETLVKLYASQEDFYQAALKGGVPKELARIHLPVGRYSRMRASANLRNWLQFLTLRDDPAAQYEIRQYAHALNGMLAETFPRTMTLFNEKRT